MTKIKFNCPSCKAKLKVPANLAGVAGPCPKCGGTIVAPLKSEEEPVTPAPAPKAAPTPAPAVASTAGRIPTPSAQTSVSAKPTRPSRVITASAVAGPPVMEAPPQPAPVIQQPVSAAPRVVAQPQINRQSSPEPRVEAPPVNRQPAHQAPSPEPPSQPAPQAQPQPAPTISNQIGFPRPLEQVSHTAAVALANSPLSFPGHNQPAQPSYQQTAPHYSQPAQQVESSPQARQDFYTPPSQQQPDPADLMPEDIFNEPPTTEFNPTANPYGLNPDPQIPAQPDSPAEADNYVPRTEPIVVKRREEEATSLDTGQVDAIPRLDASLADGGSGTLSSSQTHAESDPTVIQLPEVGSEDSQDFSINPPATERAEYRPPNPVALTPPGEEAAAVQDPVIEEAPEDYSRSVEPEFPLDDQIIQPQEYEDFVAEQDIQDPGEGSVAAFLAEAMEASSSGNSGKTKDEILDELLGVAPKTKRKKGLSGTTKFMLAVLAAVAVCAAIGVYYAFDKLGGFGVAGENVFGTQGLENLKNKTSGISISKITRPGEAESTDTPIEVELVDTEAPPEMIDIPSIEDAVDEMKDEVDKELASLGAPDNSKAVEKVQEAIETAQVPAIEPVKPIVPNPPAPSPLPDVTKENYNPPPSFPAPGPDDPPLKNTHDLVDAFMRAPNWQARIPYIYNGESLRSKIAEYYQKWPDFSYDRFKMKLFQMELEEEFGGPFWVYQITKSDADPGGVPTIIRVENGNLKVDWNVYSEFSDEHYVKFREGKISAPATFRLVAERVSEYPGADKPGFTDLNDYICFELNPPYGGYRAFSEYAFVKKGTSVANTLDQKIGLGDEPLAVILTLNRKDFSHGIRHYIITDFVDEGWFN
ncbi:MAG: hypothetical protein P1V20_19505 [Verrucomicrobiales bacterium]|nr:hypothetical protein [Verrucomicrobiales bacterium]